MMVHFVGRIRPPFTLLRNAAQEHLIVTSRSKRRIREQGNKAKFEKQLYGVLLPVAITPTNVWYALTLNVDDYMQKASKKKDHTIG